MKTRFILAAYIFLVTAIIIPVIGLSTLPFTDIPNHLAEATILKHAADPTSVLAQFYSPSRLSWFQPNTAHAAICSWFPSVEGGNKLLYVVYCLAIPLLMLVIARMCEGNGFIALLSGVTIWNFNALWGFAGFTLGIPLVLISVYLHIRCITKRSWLDIVLIGLLFLLLYWFHVLLFLFALFLYIMIELCNVAATLTSGRQMLYRLTALMPASGLFVTWVGNGSEFKGGAIVHFFKQYYLHQYIPSLLGRITDFIMADWCSIAYGDIGKMIAILFTMVLLIPAVVCLCRLPYHNASLTAPRVTTLAFVATAFFCFIFLPAYLPEQAILNERYSVFCYLGIISVLAWALPIYWPSFKSTTVVMAAIIWYAILFGQYFWDFWTIDDVFVSFARTGPDLKGKMVGYLIDEPNFRGRSALIHYNNYQTIWNMGPTPTKAVEYRYRMINQIGSLPSYQEWVSRQPSTNIPVLIDRYSHCDYLVTQGKRPDDAVNQRKDFMRVHKVGTWCLFKRVNTANSESPRDLVEPKR